MLLEVQWFVSALVENELLDLEDAVELNQEMGGEATLVDFSAAILESVSAQYEEADALAATERINECIAFAQEQAATGAVPALFAETANAPAGEEENVLSAEEENIPPLPEDREDAFTVPPLPGEKRTVLPKAAPAKKLAGPPGGFGGALPKTVPGVKIPTANTMGEEGESGEDADDGSFVTAIQSEGMAYGQLDISPYIDENGTYTGPRSPLGLPSLANISEMSNDQLSALIQSLLIELRAYGASDLHLSAMAQPFIRRNLELERIEDVVLSREDAERCNSCLLSSEQVKKFRTDQDMTFALEIGCDRFRTALILHKDGVAGSYRLVPDKIPSLAELGFMPKDVETLERLMDYPNGLVLVTGPIGSGKTTTLASLVDIANARREDHIITVEDPIEILQKSKNCQVTQRQVGSHTKSYSSALKGALREDPDIIVIGEMHDLETIENAITAAETGHLVIGTLHTRDAANTMNRILDVFPPNQQPQIRSMTAGSLRGVVCQKLVKGADGKLCVVYEILINTLAVANVISEGKIFQLRGNMQIGAKVGMCTIDQTLLEKWKVGAISYDTAREGMTDKSVIAILEKENAVRQAQKFAEAAAAEAAAKAAAEGKK